MTEPSTPSKDGMKALFTEKEQKAMLVAWQCLKSGPPEIDAEKFTRLAGFNTAKTATNTWSTIKKKLLSGTDMATSTPGSGGTKAANTPKSKRGAKAVDGNDADTESPSKKRKPNAKKAVKTEVKDEDGDNDEPVFSGKSQAPAEPTAEAKEQKQPNAKDGAPDGEVAAAARTLLTATQAMNGSSAPDV